MDFIKDKIGYISLGVSAVNLLTAIIGLITKLFSQPWFQGVYIAFSLLVLLCFGYLLHEKKKNTKAIEDLKIEKDEEINKLESEKTDLSNENYLFKSNICSGLELLSNKVTIEFIKGSTPSDCKYKLTFCKTCRVIGENKWYSGQVYFNNKLFDETESEDFYEKNRIDWETLKASARIKTYQYHPYMEVVQDAEIYAVAKSSRYFQFHIRYGTSGGRIDPKKYDKFEIIYSYEVPISHWGSYINRTVSCFGEPTEVVFKLCKNGRAKQQREFAHIFSDSVCVYEKKLDDEPSLLDSVHCEEPELDGEYINIRVKIPSSRAKKFVVSWDPSKYFGKDFQRTEIVKDSAELTAY